MTYEQWEEGVPGVIRQDALWRMKAYRLGLFVSDLAWEDGAKLLKNRLSASLGDQLVRAVDYISSNIAEGYSRGTGKDRARFYEYALGSAREARDWYYKGRRVLGHSVAEHRLELTTELIKLLVAMTDNERSRNRRLDGAQPSRKTLRTNH